jgi:O-antigen ligase
MISPDTRQALGLWKAYILEPILLYLVFINTIKTNKQIKMIVFGLGISVVFISVVTIWQYIGWIDIPGDYAFEIPKRATSVFPFPTAVGKFVGPLLGLFLGLLLVKSNESKQIQTGNDMLWRNIFLWGVVLFSIIALTLSFSRGALIGVFSAIFFISFFSKWKKWIFSGMAVVILLALLIPVTRNSITDVFNTSDTSTDVHLVMWKGAVRIIKDNPITGTGLASFPIVYDDYKEASHTEYFPNPDHLILSLWIEMGIAGLIIFSWIVILFFRSGIKLIKYDRKWAVALLASVVVILVHGLMDTPYFKNDLSAMFWILIGLMVVICNKYEIDDSSEKIR